MSRQTARLAPGVDPKSSEEDKSNFVHSRGSCANRCQARDTGATWRLSSAGVNSENTRKRSSTGRRSKEQHEEGDEEVEVDEDELDEDELDEDELDEDEVDEDEDEEEILAVTADADAEGGVNCGASGKGGIDKDGASLAKQTFSFSIFSLELCMQSLIVELLHDASLLLDGMFFGSFPTSS